MLISDADAQTSISGLDLINLFAAASSIVLAVVALALSIFFFVQSKRDAERSNQSAQDISSSVERLEKIFDSLYSDTFSMMRDTVSDMRKHVWTAVPSNSSQNDDGTDSDNATERALVSQISEISQRLGLTDEKLAELRRQVEPLVSEALERPNGKERSTFIQRAMKAEVRRAALMQSRHFTRPMTLQSLARALHADENEVASAVFELGRDGILEWEGAPISLGYEQPIRYVPYKERNPSTSPAQDSANGPAS
jgi:hypothetical protein